MLSQPVLNRKVGYSSIITERCSEAIWIFDDVMPKFFDPLLTLTFELTFEIY